MGKKKSTSKIKELASKYGPYAGSAIAGYAASYGVPPEVTLGVLAKLAGLFGG